MSEKDTIRKLGLAVRKHLYRLHRYYPEAIARDLTGACAIGSVIMTRLLRRMGLAPVFVVGVYESSTQNSPHAWVELDGEIVDVTATQFGRHLPAVLFTGADDERYTESHRGRGALVQTNRWCKEKGAMADQAPSRHERDIRVAIREILAG